MSPSSVRYMSPSSVRYVSVFCSICLILLFDMSPYSVRYMSLSSVRYMSPSSVRYMSPSSVRYVSVFCSIYVSFFCSICVSVFCSIYVSVLCSICLRLLFDIQGGSNMTATDFFLNHNYQTLTCTYQSSTYSPPESTQFFQRSGSILMPFSKKDCGWRLIHSRTVWMTASLSANRMPSSLI